MPSLHAMNRRRLRESAPQAAMVAAGTTGDSERSGFTPKAQPGTVEYKHKVAEPTMRAIDGLPKEWRALVADFDYIPCYLAWRSRRWTPAMVREKAEANGGVFAVLGSSLTKPILPGICREETGLRGIAADATARQQ